MHQSITDNFDKFFEILVADTDALKLESYKIRHHVYAEQLGWEAKNEKGLETDVFDDTAIPLLLLHKRTQTFAGTVRVAIPSHDTTHPKMPCELIHPQVVDKHIFDPASLKKGSFGELSRLAVPGSFRRRAKEQPKPYVVPTLYDMDIFSVEERRNFPNIALGLIMGSITLSKHMGYSYLFVVLEPRLSKILARFGLNFIQCGDEVEYHGRRALHYLDVNTVAQDLNAEMSDLYALLREQLHL